MRFHGSRFLPALGVGVASMLAMTIGGLAQQAAPLQVRRRRRRRVAAAAAAVSAPVLFSRRG